MNQTNDAIDNGGFPLVRRSSNRLLIFARAPEPGQVKSRLAASIGVERATRLYAAMIEDLLEAIGGADSEIDVEILWTASGEIRGTEILQRFPGWFLSEQCGKDLGERLTVAFSERVIFNGATKIIAIGADLPSLDRQAVSNAFALLDSCEWVVGPATDGGYYLIGCRGGAFHPLVFEKIEWGGTGVLETTISRIRSLGAPVALLPRRTDLDRMDDIAPFLKESEGQAPRVEALLAEWGLR